MFAIVAPQNGEHVPAPPLTDLLETWQLPDRQVLPDDPAGGIRSTAVFLGEWWSPEGHPWDVSVVRTNWAVAPGIASRALPDGSAGEVEWAPVPVAHGCPALLLVPRAMAVPGGDVVAEFSRWEEQKRHGASAPWRVQPKRASWAADSVPTSVLVTWLGTATAAEAPPPRGKDRRDLRLRLNDAIDGNPWMLLLSWGLLRAASADLRLPPELSDASILAAVRGAGMERERLKKVRELDRVPEVQAVQVGAYAILCEAGRNKTRASVFVDGKGATGLLSGSGTAKRLDKWRRTQARKRVWPYLVPLTFDLREEEPEDLEVWTTRWLTDGRAEVGLWLAFGEAISRFRWAGVRGPRAHVGWVGRNIFHRAAWAPRVEATREEDYVGHRVVWEPRQAGPLGARQPGQGSTEGAVGLEHRDGERIDGS